MIKIIPDVYLLQKTKGANIYLLVSGKDLTLVDSGSAAGADAIKAQIQEAGYDLSDLKRIVLTHSHGDHTGNTLELVRVSGAEVLAHRDETPYIEKTAVLPAASLGKRILNWLGDNLLFRLQPCKVDQKLEDGDTVPGDSGFQVVNTPGHTPGSICLYHPEKKCLITGDALFNENPATGKPGLRLPIRLFTVDNAQAFESVRMMAALDVDVLCCGHGDPILSQAGERINQLLQSNGA